MTLSSHFLPSDSHSMKTLTSTPLLLLLCSCVQVEDGPRFVRADSVKVAVLHSRDGGIEVVNASLPQSNEYELTIEVTAYCPCARCCGKMTGRTSTESNAWRPGIAVCPGALPYGTLIHVPGYDRAEWAVTDDTGSAMKKAWKKGKVLLDVRMTYHWQAVQWGRQLLTVRIREP
jgi:3D (Asp-Asp-Asp) domain-containing protein